jgi:hypothetical protein
LLASSKVLQEETNRVEHHSTGQGYGPGGQSLLRFWRC